MGKIGSSGMDRVLAALFLFSREHGMDHDMAKINLSERVRGYLENNARKTIYPMEQGWPDEDKAVKEEIASIKATADMLAAGFIFFQEHGKENGIVGIVGLKNELFDFAGIKAHIYTHPVMGKLPEGEQLPAANVLLEGIEEVLPPAAELKGNDVLAKGSFIRLSFFLEGLKDV